MKKTLLAKERDNFLNSEEGKKLCEGVASGRYLQNRIERAFLAGVQAQERISSCHSDNKENEK